MSEENNEQEREPMDHNFDAKKYPNLAKRVEEYFPQHVKQTDEHKTR